MQDGDPASLDGAIETWDKIVAAPGFEAAHPGLRGIVLNDSAKRLS